MSYDTVSIAPFFMIFLSEIQSNTFYFVHSILHATSSIWYWIIFYSYTCLFICLINVLIIRKFIICIGVWPLQPKVPIYAYCINSLIITFALNILIVFWYSLAYPSLSASIHTSLGGYLAWILWNLESNLIWNAFNLFILFYTTLIKWNF